MTLPPISTVLEGIQHIPNRATQDLLQFEAAATQFASEIKTLGEQANTWAGEVNALKEAINVILGLLQDPLDPPADILRYVRSPGDIVWSTGPTPGVGTLVADGSAVSRTTYADLWARYNAAGWSWEECTISVASPGVVTNADHGFTGGERLRFRAAGGALPTGLSASADYFVVRIDDDTFKLSSTQGTVTYVNTTGAGSGTFSYCQSLWGIGNGTSTFNLPNLLGLFAAGVSAYGSVTSGRDANRKLGHVLASQNLAHTHAIDCSRHVISEAGASQGYDVGFYPETVTEPEGGAEAYPWHVGLLPCVVY